MKIKDIPPSKACIVLKPGPAPLRMRAVAAAIGVASEEYRDERKRGPRVTAVAITDNSGRIAGVIEAHELITDMGTVRSQHPEAHTCIGDRGKFECDITDDVRNVYRRMIAVDANFAVVRGGPTEYVVSRGDIAEEIVVLQDAALRLLGTTAARELAA